MHLPLTLAAAAAALTLPACSSQGLLYVVPVSRATFAHRFPDTPALERRQVGCLIYDAAPRFPVDLTLPPRAYGSLPP